MAVAIQIQKYVTRFLTSLLHGHSLTDDSILEPLTTDGGKQVYMYVYILVILFFKDNYVSENRNAELLLNPNPSA